VLCTVGGAPSIYYGDEQGFVGIKEDRAGGDEAIRPTFPATPGDLAPHGWPLYRVHQRLIGLRRRHPWLSQAHTRASHLTNTAAAFESRSRQDPTRRIVTVLNVGDAPFGLPADVTGSLSLLEADTPDDGRATGVVPAHGWSILG
jgi:glycosidase